MGDWMHPDDREWLEQHEEAVERQRAHDERLAAKDRLLEKGPLTNVGLVGELLPPLRRLNDELNAAMLDVHAGGESWNELHDVGDAIACLAGRNVIWNPETRELYDVKVTSWVVDELHVWPADSELPHLVASFPVPEGMIFGSTALDAVREGLVTEAMIVDAEHRAALEERNSLVARLWKMVRRA